MAVIGVVLVCVYVSALMWSMAYTTYDVWGGVALAPVLFLLSWPLARRVAQVEDDPRLVQLILLALVCKLIGALLRYWVAFGLYDGTADASMYINTGKELAESFRQGVFDVPGGRGGDGTVFTRRLTGYVFMVIGPTAVGGFLVFSWFGFWGLYCFYRAFRIGVPDGDHRRYALLVFFMPSLLFWPSSVGKEAWMLLTLGVGAYGAARVLTRKRGGYLTLAAALWGAVQVRPHMAALLMCGVAAAYLLRRSAKRTTFGPVARAVGAVVVLGVLLVTVQAAERRFGVEGEGVSGAEQALDDASERTSKGGSEFDAERPNSPLDVPIAAFTVLFRPLPHEAHNAQALVTSLEGLFLMGLFLVSWRRLRQVVRKAWRSPYVAMASVYSLLFIMAFSSFGNFGILVRQRAQLFPFVLILLALPQVQQRGANVLPRRMGSRQRPFRRFGSANT